MIVVNSPGKCAALGALAGLLFLTAACSASAQVREGDEVVANLAAGRVVVLVVKDAIVVGAVQQSLEANSIAPRLVSVSGNHVAILLGAAEWVLPGARAVRLERSAPRLTGDPSRAAAGDAEGASDIEQIGVGFLERLRPLVEQLHHKIDLGADEPILEILLLGYATDYGPEVWLLKYRVVQDLLRGDYYRTRPLRPSYTQLYPPEKRRPRTLIEISYPEDPRAETMLQLIERNDPRIEQIRASDKKITHAVQCIESGKSQDAPLDGAKKFLETSLAAIAEGNQFFVGVYQEQRGLTWVVPPAQTSEEAREEKQRPPGAPTLRKKP